MSDIKYSTDHEWVTLDQDGNAVIGISDFAQKELGDIVFVELPDIDSEWQQDDEIAVVESVKAASDIKVPVSGTVVAVNETLLDKPETVNSDPEGEGWFFKLKLTDTAQLDQLMDTDAYAGFVDQ